MMPPKYSNTGEAIISLVARARVFASSAHHRSYRYLPGTVRYVWYVLHHVMREVGTLTANFQIETRACFLLQR